MKHLRKVLRQLLRAEDPARPINVRYNYPNFQEKGFLVAVDGIDNFPQTAGYTWVGAVVSPFPAAMYYSSGFKVASDLKVVHKLNYDSDAACPRWEDGWQWYDACDPDQHGYLCMIIDVRARLISTKEVGPKAKPVKVLNPRMVQIGFSILPIFTRGGQYTQTGNWKLPLFRLGPRPDFVESNPQRYWNLQVPEERARGAGAGAGAAPRAGDELPDELLGCPDGPNVPLLDRIALSASGAHDAIVQALTLGEIHLVDSASLLCRVNDGTRYRDELETSFTPQGGPHNVDDSLIKNYMPAEMFRQYERAPQRQSIRERCKRDINAKDPSQHIRENIQTLTNLMNFTEGALEAKLPAHPNCTEPVVHPPPAATGMASAAGAAGGSRAPSRAASQTPGAGGAPASAGGGPGRVESKSSQRSRGSIFSTRR